MVSAMDCVMNGGAVAAHLPTITFMPQLFHHEGLDHFHESIGDGARKMDAIVADFLLAHAAFTVEPGDQVVAVVWNAEQQLFVVLVDDRFHLFCQLFDSFAGVGTDEERARELDRQILFATRVPERIDFVEDGDDLFLLSVIFDELEVLLVKVSVQIDNLVKKLSHIP